VTACARAPDRRAWPWLVAVVAGAALAGCAPHVYQAAPLQREALPQRHARAQLDDPGHAALLAGLGVLNGLLLAALERSKEVGVLRALGATDGQIASAVLLESSLLGLAGGVLGLFVGLAMTPVLVVALRALSGLELPLRLAFVPGLQAVALAVFLGLVAGLYPVHRMRRMDPVRAVRTG